MKQYTLKKIITIWLLLIMLIFFGISNVKANSEVSLKVDLNEADINGFINSRLGVEDNNTLPEKYDTRSIINIEVKNQGGT